jgi:hypothetical protein
LAAQNIRAYRRRGASEASPGGVNRARLSDVAFVRRNQIPPTHSFHDEKVTLRDVPVHGRFTPSALI